MKKITQDVYWLR